MCGLVGLVGIGGEAAVLKAYAQAMADALRHRGPDDQGLWLDENGPVALGHRRLAIVDLSPLGHQPMQSADGRYVLVFNGEIYNFQALRAELAALGYPFRSRSDTEVMLAGFVHWGWEATLQRLAGMFALALWDRQERSLLLARDRLGKKPLYVVRRGAGLAFASELKALWTLPGFAPRVSAEAVEGFFRYGYVADNLCIFEDCFKLQPGEWLLWRAQAGEQRGRFWTLEETVGQAQGWRLGSLDEAKRGLEEVLALATAERMVSDVPLGAFLSGGIDSALVVSQMQRAGCGQTRSFSIAFEEASHNEAPVAAAVARHLGCAHTELLVSQRDALALVPRLPEVYDEPFADASMIPTTLLAGLARQHVTVALTGDGGDEAFGGYLRYRGEQGVVGALFGLPMPLRRLLAEALDAPSAARWEQLAAWLPAHRRPRFLGQKVHKLARGLRCADADARARMFLTLWAEGQPLRRPPDGLSELEFVAGPELRLAGSERMQFWETGHYLSGDLLVKMDRATMAASLEARSPLLDHRVVAYAWRLQTELKAGPRMLKRVLRELLFERVPRSLIDLPKQGFSVPLGPWLLQELRPWAESQWAYVRQELGDWLDADAVAASWQSHQRGAPGQVDRLWAVLMFAAWHQRWLRGGSGT
ncbi:asparagine synthase (glutamine-hydrolyzing) [Paucibacter soli]|uniref:asparagine synthase (glutamine-hydrolyzing) n=1 Tax=Paucibacter soli TaxID=3133433 RepID=UPI0030A2A119